MRIASAFSMPLIAAVATSSTAPIIAISASHERPDPKSGRFIGSRVARKPICFEDIDNALLDIDEGRGCRLGDAEMRN